MAEYQRKCRNWLLTFGEWTMPRSEAPETFITWTGLFTLASALRRHVSIPKRLLGSWAASPNLYILFIAPAGRARKSTTANYAEDLINAIPNITKSPELVTKESLLTTLVKSEDSSMCVIAPEFGEFIAKSGPTMFGFLTNMFDGKKDISVKTLSRGAEFAERPCINLIGATTPEWVAENMPESVIGGGFASRVVFIFEDKVRRRKLWYDDLDQARLAQLQEDLIADLTHISLNINGEFSLDDEAKKFAEEWYDRTAEDGYKASNKLSGYYERKPAHVLKVAQLLHISYSDELILHKPDIDVAIDLLNGLEKRLPKVFESIGKNPHTIDAHRIVDYIKEKGSCKTDEIRRHFMHVATPSVLSDLIGGLIQAKLLVLDKDDLSVNAEMLATLNGKPK